MPVCDRGCHGKATLRSADKRETSASTVLLNGELGHVSSCGGHPFDTRIRCRRSCASRVRGPDDRVNRRETPDFSATARGLASRRRSLDQEWPCCTVGSPVVPRPF